MEHGFDILKLKKCQQRILKTKDTGSLKDMVEEEEEETKDTEDYCG